MKLSIIIPCKNEEGNIELLYKKINEVLKDVRFEAIFIDDGSTDKTLEQLKALYETDMQHVKVLSFSRNFMKEAAMLAGLKHATGEYTCFVDADLQQNPKYILEMLNFLEEHDDYDEVGMAMENQNHSSKIMNLGKNCFYKLMNKLCDVKLEHAVSDFRMFRTNVKEAMISLGEKTRFTKGIFAWVGFKVKYLPYEVEPRQNGETSFGFINSMKYAIVGILSFSTKPLKWSFNIGLFSLLCSFIYILVMLIQILCGNAYFELTHILIILVLLLFGLQFIIMGIIGAYIANINTEVRSRPVYIIKEKLGFDDNGIL